jgi:hypothetical protein
MTHPQQTEVVKIQPDPEDLAIHSSIAIEKMPFKHDFSGQ